MDVSRETQERLDHFVALVEKWTQKINLISRDSLRHIQRRHVLDSLQLVTSVNTPDHWADLGSGGGFPGVVIAIVAREWAPDMNVSLVESDLRKATFLRTALRETGCSATVLSQRIESCDPLDAGVVSARALAPLTTLLDYCERHLAPNGVGLFPKGRTAAEEVETALERWSFDCETVPSRTDPEAVVLKIGDIRRV